LQRFIFFGAKVKSEVASYRGKYSWGYSWGTPTQTIFSKVIYLPLQVIVGYLTLSLEGGCSFLNRLAT
jgi:hypothetical protein